MDASANSKPCLVSDGDDHNDDVGDGDCDDDDKMTPDAVDVAVMITIC